MYAILGHYPPRVHLFSIHTCVNIMCIVYTAQVLIIKKKLLY